MPKPETTPSTEPAAPVNGAAEQTDEQVNLTPLQKLKARQAAQASNRATKEKRPDPSADKTQGGGSQATPKQMRSSASKIGS